MRTLVDVLRDFVFATCLLLLAVGSAHAAIAVLDFEDLAIIPGTRVSFADAGYENYRGYAWTGLNEPTPGASWGLAEISSFHPLDVGGENFAWNYGGAQTLFLDFMVPTRVLDVRLAWLSPEYQFSATSVQVFGFDKRGDLVRQSDPFILDATLRTLTLDFSGVYKVAFKADAELKWFSMDDIRIQGNVPEPSSLALLGLGLAGLAFTLRRKQ